MPPLKINKLKVQSQGAFTVGPRGPLTKWPASWPSLSVPTTPDLYLFFLILFLD